MRVLQFGKYYPPDRGGIETVTHGLAQSLNAAGVPCDVLCFHRENQLVEETHERHRVTRCPSVAHAFSTPLSWRSIGIFRERMTDYDVVVVHLPNPTANVALALSGYRGRVVLFWHCDVVRYPKLMRAYRPLQNWLIERADLVIGATDSHIRESDSAALLADKSIVIPFGLDPAIFTSESVDAETRRIVDDLAGRRVVLSVGRFVSYKGMAHLIDAARLLPDDYAVVLVGGGPEENAYRERIASLGLGKRVVLLGEARPARLAALYERCDVFCLPSVDRAEMFGMVQIEAMHFGKPIVSTRIPRSGTHHVNIDGETGRVVPHSDPAALAKAIDEIGSDPARQAAMAEACRRHFAARFDSEVVARRHVEAYRALLDDTVERAVSGPPASR